MSRWRIEPLAQCHWRDAFDCGVDSFNRFLRAHAGQIGIHAVAVHALDERARSFYIAHGFIPLLDDARHLFIPMASIRQL